MPVRISGYACRLPGARNVNEFWRILADQRCTVTSIPDDRFESRRFLHPDRETRGTSVTFAAGVIDGVFDFDAPFFGISPREAVQMDPQQRLVLQVVWEALESAGVAPSSLAGQEVGVFVGASSFDYLYRFINDPAICDTQMMTGNTLSIIANRISYQFDLRGPSLTIDTACSSSLFALAEACQAIAERRIDKAIVVGVNLLTAPYPFVGFSIAHMLSANGLCRAFDAAGDGYVRSEGAVALLLEASDRSASPGLGDLVAWGTNADGRTSGLSLPSSSSQAALLRKVYGSFSLDPRELAFIEAHGTGTRVGDPAEASAIGETLGRKRAAPLPIGSVKTNVGHLEPASGLVGVLKAALALRHGTLPASLHFETPNPDIPFGDLNLEVANSPLELDVERTPLAGVNSFGFGGANAHVVLRAPERQSPSARPSQRLAPLVLTARSDAALRKLASAYRSQIADDAAGDAADVGAIANAAAYGRDFLDHRAVIVADDRASVVEALDALVEARENPRLVVGRAQSRSAKTLFAFSGNGSQWAGMGRAALASDPQFADAIAHVDAELSPLVGWSTLDVLKAQDLEERLREAHVAQPLLFAIQVAVVIALAARGVRPDAVVGHSVGEVAAAWAAGALSLADAAKVIDARSRSQEYVRGAGAMAALNAPADAVAAALADSTFDGVEIAAFNAPGSLTMSGPVEALDRFLKVARANRWPFRRLAIEYPYHTALLEPTREALSADLRGIRARAAHTTFYSSVFGEEADCARLDASYWWQNVRQPVLFEKAVAAALETGPAVAIEIGPSPVLGGYLNATARENARSLAVLPSLQREDDAADASPLEIVAARALASGADVDKSIVFGAPAKITCELPHYPWDQATFKPAPSAEASNDFTLRPHPLLGIPARGGDDDFFNHLSVATYPWIADHQAGGVVVVPAAAIIDGALAAAREVLGAGALELRDCAIGRPLHLEEGATYETKWRVNSEERLIDLFSRRRGAQGDWVHHARTVFSTVAAAPSRHDQDKSAPAEPREILTGAQMYEIARSRQLDYGPFFQVVDRVDLIDDDRARVHFAASKLTYDGMLCDPTLIDGGLQGVLCLLALRDASGKAFLPTRFHRFRVYNPGGAIASCDIRMQRASAESALVDIVYRSADGAPVAEISGGRCMAVRLKQAERAPETYATVPLAVAPCGATGQPLPPLSDFEIVARSDDALRAASEAALHAGLAKLFGETLFDARFPEPGECANLEPALLENVLERMASCGLAAREKQRWKLAAAAQGRGALGRLLEAAPERAVEATFLAATAEQCGSLLASAPSPSFPPHVFDALLYRSRSAIELGEIVTRFAQTCLNAGARPLRVLVAGAAGAMAIRTLLQASHPRLLSLCLVDEDAARRQDMDRAFAAFPAFSTASAHDAPSGVFDLVLAVNPRFCNAAFSPEWLHERLADRGRLAVFEWDGDCLAAAVELAARNLGRIGAARPASLPPDFVDVVTRRLDGVAITIGEAAGSPRLAPGAAAPASVRFWPSADDPADLESQLAARLSGAIPTLDEPTGPETIVHIACCAPPGDDPVSWIVDRCVEIKEAARSFEGRDGRLVIVAPGAVRSLADREGGSAQAHAVLGFVRVCANEFPRCDFRLIDVAGEPAKVSALDMIAAEIAAPGLERELLLDENARIGLRIVAAPVGALGARAGAGETTCRLEAPAQGSIERVVWTRAERRAPGPNEIEIETRATGLNFRDVMWSLGALPPEALEDGFAGPTLGLECAGVVARVGSGVSRFAPGQACVAFAPHAFSGHVTIPEYAAAHVPQDMPFEAAATIPVSFVTVYYSLVTLARLAANETVLVHGGAGGVGLAALQVAKLCGARVIATAGQSEKRTLLLDAGADFVFDSRGRAFADEVLAATGGRGVDVVLNSLAGEAMALSIGCLAPFGRFVELGKADFFGDTRIGLRPFSRNLSYFGVDADQLLTRQPELAQRLFGEISALLREGKLKAIPYNLFDGEEIAEALRLMQRSHHVGKIVVRPPRSGVEERRSGLLEMKDDATYVLIGGKGGFGLALARRLVGRGAGRLVLAGRSAPSPEVAAQLDALRARGAEIVDRQVDATDGRALSALLDEFDASDLPVRGVFHCAMTLDDRLLENMDADALRSVLHTKISIAENLHAWSASRKLDHFVLFSSATTFVGNPGQANYVAANAYLEELARKRRRAGLPALAVAWGPLSDVGYLAGDDPLARIAARKLARHSISSGAALDCFERAVFRDDGSVRSAVVGIGRFDFAALRRELALLASTAFDRLAPGAASSDETPEGTSLARILATLPATEARDRIAEILRTEIARILRAPVDQVEVTKPLSELGVDSLMGVELRLAAEEQLGIDVPLLAIGGAGSIIDLADRCLRQLRSAGHTEAHAG